ncbi:Cytokinin riboside 5'-monophosphate phosphoribohydrolase [Psidium guajava]|nr:Cytokinin riboside 5'-monophosphate phosphoribohydrolase [Psidium guajava]
MPLRTAVAHRATPESSAGQPCPANDPKHPSSRLVVRPHTPSVHPSFLRKRAKGELFQLQERVHVFTMIPRTSLNLRASFTYAVKMLASPSSTSATSIMDVQNKSMNVSSSSSFTIHLG